MRRFYSSRRFLSVDLTQRGYAVGDRPVKNTLGAPGWSPLRPGGIVNRGVEESGPEAMSLRMRLIVAGLALALAGCSSVPIEKAFGEEQLKQRCELTGGWWHPDQLMGGFCEYQAPGGLV